MSRGLFFEAIDEVSQAEAPHLNVVCTLVCALIQFILCAVDIWTLPEHSRLTPVDFPFHVFVIGQV